MTEPRFFIDHGMIHDRITGKHVTTDEDSVFQDGIKCCCDLLNSFVDAVADMVGVFEGLGFLDDDLDPEDFAALQAARAVINSRAVLRGEQ